MILLKNKLEQIQQLTFDEKIDWKFANDDRYWGYDLIQL